MESLLENVHDLRQRTPYWDLEIKCDGVSFFVHRFVVCSKSKLLVAECDGGSKGADATTIEHTVFDALTLERMLLFMYQRDYAVSTSNTVIMKVNEEDEGREKLADASKSTSTHLRNDARAVISAGVAQKSVYGQMTAHVYVYAIAEYYAIADLKALALARFKRSDVVLSVDEFLEVAKAVYKNTFTMKNELRSELLSTLITKYSEWTADAHFMSILADDEELRIFALAVVSALSQRFAEQAKAFQTQHEANFQLHNGLEQVTEDLKKANNQIAELRAELKKTASANVDLEEKVVVYEKWSKENLEKAGNNYKAVQERDDLIKKETQRADQLFELLRKKEEEMKGQDEKIAERDRKIKEETERANQNDQLCVQKDQLIREKYKKLKKETERADGNYQAMKEETTRATKNYESYMQKDHEIKVRKMNEEAAKAAEVGQRARAEKAFLQFHQAQRLLDRTSQCRYCGTGCFPRLLKDREKNVYIQCKSCHARDYVEQVD